MTQSIDRARAYFDSDEPSAAEEYQALVRALRRKKGFGLFFVQVSPEQGQEILRDLRQDLAQKHVVEVSLTRSDERLFEQLETVLERENVDIFWVDGLAQSLLGYEDMLRLAGWDEQDLMTYSWKDVPPILSHLNLGRERFELRFDFPLVFVVPLFVVKYLLRRAGDFFDWKSGFFEFPDDMHSFAKQVVQDGDYSNYIELDTVERQKKILQIKDCLDTSKIDPDQRAKLLREIGRLFYAGQYYEQALLSFNQAIEIKQDFLEAWNDRGHIMRKLGRYEEARKSYNRGSGIQLAVHYNDLGNYCYGQKDYDGAIKAYQESIKLDPKFVKSYRSLGKIHRRRKDYHAAIEIYQKGINLSQNLNFSLIVVRGESYALAGCYNESLQDFDQLLMFDPRTEWIYYFRSLVYTQLNQVSTAQGDLQQAIEISEAICKEDVMDWKTTFNLALYYLAAHNTLKSEKLYNDNFNAPADCIDVAICDLDDFLHFFPDHIQAQRIQQLLQEIFDQSQGLILTK